MYPWKIAFRFVSAVVLFATGGYAAGADLPLPFEAAPTEVSAPAAPAPEAPTTDTTLPADDDDADDDAATDDSTTTTTAPDTSAPDTAAPDIVDPDTETAPAPPVIDVPTAPEAPDATDIPTAPTAAPDPAPTEVADPEAPEVCAEAGTATCGVDPAADNSFDARVARCRAWWSALADGLDERGRPRMAQQARRVADRCDEMIARWQQWQERRQPREDRRDERPVDRKVKGDHNNDGRPDNGWHNKDRDRGDRDDNRSGRARQVSRHSEGRR